MATVRDRGAALATSGPGIGPIVVLVLVVATPVGLAVMLDGSTYDTWGAFIWAPVLLMLALPLCRWMARRTGEPEVAGFLFGAAALKIVVGAALRYYMVDAVYGAGDAFRYDDAAAELVGPFRQGELGGLGKVTGTRFLEIVDGLVQAVIGETMVGAFLVFSAMGFVGFCFLYLAFCEAHPSGDSTLYRRLLFLTPTLWFWPSSVGKEAFLMLCIGATAYGFARLLSGHLTGVVLTALGLWGAAVVRPHIALMLLVGAAFALPPSPVRPAPAPHDPVGVRRRPIGRFLLPLLVLVAIPASLGAAETFFDIDGLNLDSATEVRDEVTRRTSTGGSEVTAPDTSNPVGLVAGVVTVVARPFPWEARGFQAIAAVEGTCLAAIGVVTIWRRRRTFLRSLGQRWPRLAIAYVLAFAWGFSAVGNFGILARQRSLMLPFLFVLLAASHRPVLQPEGEAVASDAEPRPLVFRPA
jgi:hypothetical protein